METINSKGEKVKNNSWYYPHELPGEINEEASETQPSLSYTVQEIMEKHVRGIRLPVMLHTTFEEADIESPQISKAIDVTEIEEMLETTRSKIMSKAKPKEDLQKQADLSADFEGKKPDE